MAPAAGMARAISRPIRATDIIPPTARCATATVSIARCAIPIVIIAKAIRLHDPVGSSGSRDEPASTVSIVVVAGPTEIYISVKEPSLIDVRL